MKIYKNLFKQINEPYSLIIKNKTTNNNPVHWDITKLSVYLLFSTMLVLTFIIMAALVKFTPLKYYLGDGDARAVRKEVISLKKQIDSLQTNSKARDYYMANLLKVINNADAMYRNVDALDIATAKQIEQQQLNKIKSASELRKLVPSAKEKDSIIKTTDSIRGLKESKPIEIKKDNTDKTIKKDAKKVNKQAK